MKRYPRFLSITRHRNAVEQARGPIRPREDPGTSHEARRPYKRILSHMTSAHATGDISLDPEIIRERSVSKTTLITHDAEKRAPGERVPRPNFERRGAQL